MAAANCITNVPRKHKIAVSAGGAFAASTPKTMLRAFPVLQNNHVWTPEFVEDEGNRGSVWRASEGVVKNRESGSGNLSLIPRADDFTTLLPLLFGGTWATNLFTPEPLCDFFDFHAEKNVAVFQHRNCKTSQASLSSSTGSPLLSLDWGIESCNYERLAAGSFDDSLVFSEFQPFVHAGSTVTIDGTVYNVDDCQIAVNNSLVTDLFYNNTNRIDVPQGEQIITFTHSSPFDTAADLGLLDIGQAADSVAASVRYEAQGGALSLQFDFPALHAPVVTPVTPAGNTPVRYNGIQWRARTVGQVANGDYQEPFTVTLDATE
jgi:hypothetical protein